MAIPAMKRVYECTRCKTPCERELLMARSVNFKLMGEGGRLIKSRTSDWLCPACVKVDPDYTAPPFKAPGALKSSFARIEPKE